MIMHFKDFQTSNHAYHISPTIDIQTKITPFKVNESHLSKFHLNRTVNESGNIVLQKLHRLEKCCLPMTKSFLRAKQHHKPSAWRWDTTAWRFLLRKNTKNSVITQCSCRLAKSSLLPSNSSQKPRKQHIIHASPDKPSLLSGGFWKNSKNVKIEKVFIIHQGTT